MFFDLYCQAAQAHSYYNKVCRRIAKQTKAEWHPGPLKKMFRILEKAEHVQSDDDDRLSFDCSKILDIVRGTLIYDTLGDEEGGVLCGIRALFDCTELQIIRVKDRFSNPTSAGWRDVLLNARMVLSNGLVLPHIVEVQLHQRDLREERMNVGGHYIYERHRALFEACEMVYGDEASLKLQDIETKKVEHGRFGALFQSTPRLSEPLCRGPRSRIRKPRMSMPAVSLLKFRQNLVDEANKSETSFDKMRQNSFAAHTTISAAGQKSNTQHETTNFKVSSHSSDANNPKLGRQRAGEHEVGSTKRSSPGIDEKNVGEHEADSFKVDKSKSLQVSVVVHSDSQKMPDTSNLDHTKIVPTKGSIFL